MGREPSRVNVVAHGRSAHVAVKKESTDGDGPRCPSPVASSLPLAAVALWLWHGVPQRLGSNPAILTSMLVALGPKVSKGESKGFQMTTLGIRSNTFETHLQEH